MSWKDIIKNTDFDYEEFFQSTSEKPEKPKERIRIANIRDKKSLERNPKNPKTKCAMCGRHLSIYDKNLSRRAKENKLNFCRQCDAQRKKNR
tara:strand:- start:788 stop:1063 length:276 start_codon:yes stop_codon:yes gene_type:complete